MPQLDIFAYFSQLMYLEFVFWPTGFYFTVAVLSSIYLTLKLRIDKFNALAGPLKYNLVRKSNRIKKFKSLEMRRFVEVITEFKDFNLDLNKINLKENLIDSNDLVMINNFPKTLYKIKILILND